MLSRAGVVEWFEHSRHWLVSGGGVIIGLGLLAYLVLVRPQLKKEARDTEFFKLKKQEQKSHPCLKWAGSSTNNVELIHDFQNEGASVSDLAVQTQLPIKVVIEPRGELKAQMMGSIKFIAKEGQLPFPIKFELRYTTELNKRAKQGFWLESAHRLPERLA
jgi:hypothetical protein